MGFLLTRHRLCLVACFISGVALLLAACGSVGSAPPTSSGLQSDAAASSTESHSVEDGHGHGAGHAEEDAPHSQQRIPNQGAVVRIVAPADGTTVSVNGEILVQIAVENFSLGEAGNHWHVYLDGVSQGMVMGHDFDQVVRGFEVGEHEIAVYLANGDHAELEEGDSIRIVVVAQ